MKKSLSVLFATLLPALTLTTTLTATSAMAHDDAQEHCYPLAHGENGLGSSNTYHIPFIHTNQFWLTYLYMTNVSDKKINVKVKFLKQNGDVNLPTNYILGGGFNNVNSPFVDLGESAVLKPFETGQIYLESSNDTNSFTGQIIWQADSCIQTALSTAYRVVRNTNNGFDQGLVLLNGGKPF